MRHDEISNCSHWQRQNRLGCDGTAGERSEGFEQTVIDQQHRHVARCEFGQTMCRQPPKHQATSAKKVKYQARNVSRYQCYRRAVTKADYNTEHKKAKCSVKKADQQKPHCLVTDEKPSHGKSAVLQRFKPNTQGVAYIYAEFEAVQTDAGKPA